MKIQLKGMEDAEKQMKRIERGLKSMRSYNGIIGSKLPYAYGIEFGRHQRSGKLARRAGGAFYIRNAINTVMSQADGDLSEGLDRVTAPGKWVIKRLALWARRLARENAPRGPRKKRKNKSGKSYRLNRSLTYYVRKSAGDGDSLGGSFGGRKV